MSVAAPERIVHLRGELDLHTRPELRALLQAHDDGEPLVVDMADVAFVDHQTVVLLLRRRGETELRNVPPSVARIRAALGL